jgi:putative endonuclease
VEVRVLFWAPRFAFGFAWRSHLAKPKAKRVRRSWSAAEAKTDCRMWYVYIIRSLANPAQEYTGCSAGLKQRVKDHNAGKSTHTAKYLPWRLVWYCAFSDKMPALAFEKYLKSHSGRAFAKKRLLSSGTETSAEHRNLESKAGV